MELSSFNQSPPRKATNAPTTRPSGQVTSFDGSSARGSSKPVVARPGQSFADALNTARDPAAAKTSAEEAQKAAGDLVSNALILPMLKQIRHSSMGKQGRFGGGIGENTFGPEFDIQIADRISHSPNMNLTANLAQRLSHRGQAVPRVKVNASHGLPQGMLSGGTASPVPASPVTVSDKMFQVSASKEGVVNHE